MEQNESSKFEYRSNKKDNIQISDKGMHHLIKCQWLGSSTLYLCILFNILRIKSDWL